MFTFREWLLLQEREVVNPAILQSYETAFKQALERLIRRTTNPTLREKFKEMLDCPIRDRRGQCRSFTDYIVGALVRSGLDSRYDIEAALNYIAEKLLMDRSTDTGQPRATVFGGFDETRPFGPDENPLQARFVTFLRWAINNIAKGKIKRLANIERRPTGTVSITPGRQRRGDPRLGVPADEIAARPSHEAAFKELLDDIAGLLAGKEAATGLPLVDLFREMMAGMRSDEQRKRFGDTRTRLGRQVIVQTVEEFARSTNNRSLLRLLARFQGEEEPEARPAAHKTVVPAKPALTDRQRDYASILSVLDRLGRPAGSADLGKYRRRWLGYAPRDAASGHRNRLEEVLANMVRDGVIVARQSRQGATQYIPGPRADAYRTGAAG